MTTEYDDVDAQALKQVVLERLAALQGELPSQAEHIGGALGRQDWLNVGERVVGIMLQEARLSEVRGLLKTARYRRTQPRETIKILKKGK